MGGKTAHYAKIEKIGLEDKILKYPFKPLTTALFGGVLDSSKIGFLKRKAIEISYKSNLQEDIFREVEPGIFDLRHWNEVRNCTKEMTKIAQE